MREGLQESNTPMTISVTRGSFFSAVHGTEVRGARTTQANSAVTAASADSSHPHSLAPFSSPGAWSACVLGSLGVAE